MGIPAVSYFSDRLNMSANYLSDMLKKETGESAKGHINRVLIDKANYHVMKEYGIDKQDALFFLPPYEWYNYSIVRCKGELW